MQQGIGRYRQHHCKTTVILWPGSSCVGAAPGVGCVKFRTADFGGNGPRLVLRDALVLSWVMPKGCENALPALRPQCKVLYVGKYSFP